MGLPHHTYLTTRYLFTLRSNRVSEMLSISTSVKLRKSQGKEGKKMAATNMQVNVADEECDDGGNEGRCGYCEVFVEFGIQCDECQRWYHDEATCSNSINATSEIFQSRNIIYKCPRCVETANPNCSWVRQSWENMTKLSINIEEMKVNVQ
ncbi:uncharacterized protein [Palaemon carinicauda]|uniref:uncharacterized protein n=1 Tax=Palaemon carinicauda TaxID=392227 RepID=UPI0035B5F1D8